MQLHIFRGVAQLVEHHVRDVGAAGSNPVTPISEKDIRADVLFVILKFL